MDVGIDYSKKSKYLETISKGTLVAFKLPDGEVKSAKVVNKSTSDRKLKLITEYNAEYIVGFEDVLWVKTGRRWPKGVYSLLKGKVKDEQTADG